MTNLILEDIRRIEAERESIEREKRRIFRKRLKALGIGLALGSVRAGGAYWKNHEVSLVDLLHSAAIATVFYQGLGANLAVWGNDVKDFFSSRKYVKIGRTFMRLFRHGRAEAERGLIEDSQDLIAEMGIITKTATDANLKLLEGDMDAGLSKLRRTYDMSTRYIERPNLFTGIIAGSLMQIASRIKRCYDRDLFDSASATSIGWDGLARKFMDNALRNAKDSNERLDVLCMLGSFYESRNKTEEAKNVFKDAINEIEVIDETTFKRVPGATSVVYVHDSELLGDTFVFKTGDENDVLRAYQKDEGVRVILRDSKNSVVLPIGVVQRNGRTFTITRRAGRYSLVDCLSEGLDEEAFEIFKTTLDEIVLLHVKAKDTVRSYGSLFADVDHRKLAHRKFLRFHEHELSCPKIYGDLTDGVDFVCDEMDTSWKSLVHRDLHPGNVIITPNGGVCIIDWEKAGVTLPHVDLVTFVENYRSRGIFSGGRSENELFDQYCENVVDSGMVSSLEESHRNAHLAGVFQHLRYSQSPSFASPNELRDVEVHHRAHCLKHLVHLEGIYDRGIKHEKIKALREGLEFCFSKA